MAESLRTRLERIAFNLFPAYFGTGGRITFIGADWREVQVEVPLSLRTRNYVGTIFGGSMYGAADPILMLMLIRNLGPGYVVWDRAAAIRFLKPGRGTLRARFLLPEQELEAIRHALATRRSVDRVYTVRLLDAEGVACAEVEKTIYVRRADGAASVEPRAASASPDGRAMPAPPARTRARPAPRRSPRRRPGRPRR
jgi:acyl-coenzyme A thioesterase PaaI-like protein